MSLINRGFYQAEVQNLLNNRLKKVMESKGHMEEMTMLFNLGAMVTPETQVLLDQRLYIAIKANRLDEFHPLVAAGAVITQETQALMDIRLAECAKNRQRLGCKMLLSIGANSTPEVKAFLNERFSC
ncbi:hypothetical protein [Endozoicomonas atrinae]|uniref:hypothetical protein n=1 Tax=Endozoicomonas atrinae TaxID=1333660 RepID=UPI001112ED8D|nr:hypothetical protein [Endozoicomonas atrinae]